MTYTRPIALPAPARTTPRMKNARAWNMISEGHHKGGKDLMYARLVRFEGGAYADIRDECEEIHHGLEAARRGEENAYFPKDLLDRVQRAQVLVDRRRGSVAVLLFCSREIDAYEIDRIMDVMSPHRQGWGRRVSRDVYEVICDEGLKPPGTAAPG